MERKDNIYLDVTIIGSVVFNEIDCLFLRWEGTLIKRGLYHGGEGRDRLARISDGFVGDGVGLSWDWIKRDRLVGGGFFDPRNDS